MVNVCASTGLSTVPLVYRGPFSKAVLLQHTSGPETLSGRGVNIREGVVVKPSTERYDATLGRVLLKSVSEAYLLRKNPQATEFS
jgi:RNA ligase (TIGR02306 family)